MIIPSHSPCVPEAAEAAMPDEEAVPGSTPCPCLLTIPQVMHHLHLSRSQIYRLIASEGLPVSRAVRVDPRALQDWLDQRARSSSTETTV